MSKANHRRLGLFAFATVLVALAGCSSGSNQLTGTQGGDSGGTTTLTQCATGTEPGCPCSADGKRIECGKVIDHTAGGQVVCGYGGEVCTNGQWSDCELGQYAPDYNGFGKGLGVAAVCTNNTCDPYCLDIVDTPSGLISIDGGYPDASFIVTEAGITLTGGQNITTPTTSDTQALAEAGLPTDGGYIFHELDPGEISSPPDPVDNFNPRISGGDVYFLLKDAAFTSVSITALVAALSGNGSTACINNPPQYDGGLPYQTVADGGGIIDNLTCQFGTGVSIGVGRYEDYQVAPYVTGLPTSTPPNTVAPYQHLLSLQQNPQATKDAVQWVYNDAYKLSGMLLQSLRGGGALPDSVIPALWEATTGGALANATIPVSYQVKRASWTSPLLSAPSGGTGSALPASELPASDTSSPSPCLTGSAPGYPCWHDQTTPIFIIFTDEPAHDGPGGWYARPQNVNNQISGSTPLLQAVPNTAPAGAAWAKINPPAPSTPTNMNGYIGPLVVSGVSQWSKVPELQYDSTNDGFKSRLYWGTVTGGVSYSSVGGAVNTFTTATDSGGVSGTLGRNSLRGAVGATTGVCKTASNSGVQVTTSCSSVSISGSGFVDPELPDVRFANSQTLNSVPYFSKTASISTKSGTTFTLTGLAGMSQSKVGQSITISGSLNLANNGTFTIASYISASSVTYVNTSLLATTDTSASLTVASSSLQDCNKTATSSAQNSFPIYAFGDSLTPGTDGVPASTSCSAATTYNATATTTATSSSFQLANATTETIDQPDGSCAANVNGACLATATNIGGTSLSGLTIGTKVVFTLTITNNLNDSQLAATFDARNAAADPFAAADCSMGVTYASPSKTCTMYVTASAPITWAVEKTAFSIGSNPSNWPNFTVSAAIYPPATAINCGSSILTANASNEATSPPLCCPCKAGYQALNSSNGTTGTLNHCNGYNGTVSCPNGQTFEPSTSSCGAASSYSCKNQVSSGATATCSPNGLGSPAWTAGAPFNSAHGVNPGSCTDCSGLTSVPGGVGINNPGGVLGCYGYSCTTPFNWGGGTNNVGGAGWTFQGSTTACIPPSGMAGAKCVAGTSAWCTNGYKLCGGQSSLTGGSWGNLGYNPPGVTASECSCTYTTTDPTPSGGAPSTGLTSIFYPTRAWAGNTTYPPTALYMGPTIAPWSTIINNSVPVLEYVNPMIFPTVGGIPWTTYYGDYNNYSARWTGQLVPPCTGTYTFACNADDYCKIEVNDQTLVQLTGCCSQVNAPYTINLTAGTPVDFKMDFEQGSGGYYGYPLWESTCSATLSGNTILNGSQWLPIPLAEFTPTGYQGDEGLGAGVTQPECVTAGNDTHTTCNYVSIGDGGQNSEAFYRFTVPANSTYYYHFGLISTDQTSIAAATASSTHPNAFLYIKRQADAESTADSAVLDCNEDAGLWNATGINGTYNGSPVNDSPEHVRSEINGKIANTTGTAQNYYLVVDNAYYTGVGSSYPFYTGLSYNYILQAGQFVEANSVAPNYYTTISALNAIKAKVIGVDLSGVSCYQAGGAYPSQYDTADWLNKLAIDTGSVNGDPSSPTYGQPFTISLRNDATGCNNHAISATTALLTSVNNAVNTLANTLRQDYTLRAIPVGAPGTTRTCTLAGVCMDVPTTSSNPTPSAFIASVKADLASPMNTASLIAVKCGTSPPGHDPDPSVALWTTWDYYHACLPGTTIQFDVAFTVPNGLEPWPTSPAPAVMRGTNDQYFIFNVAIEGNGGIISETPVVIKVPAATPAQTDFVRDYDSTGLCLPGHHVSWTTYSYTSKSPSASGPSDNSEIDFYVGTADTKAALPAAGASGEYPLAISTEYMTTTCTGSVPRNEACAVDVSAALAAHGAVATHTFLRIRAHLSVSQDTVNAPTLSSWNMALSCPSTE